MNDGGAAFPRPRDIDGGAFDPGSDGMSMRVWLTGMALAGLCSNEGHTSANNPRYAEVTDAAWRFADTTLAGMPVERT